MLRQHKFQNVHEKRQVFVSSLAYFYNVIIVTAHNDRLLDKTASPMGLGYNHPLAVRIAHP